MQSKQFFFISNGHILQDMYLGDDNNVVLGDTIPIPTLMVENRHVTRKWRGFNRSEDK